MKPAKVIAVALLTFTSCTYSGHLPTNESADSLTSYTDDEKEAWSMADRLIQPGAFAPIINLPSLSGKDKVDCNPKQLHVLLFWASWCKDCKAETAATQRFQREHPDIPWVTVSLDSEAAKARQYLYENKITGTHLFDGRDWRGDACTDYAVALHGIPYIILIDSAGKIKATCGTVSELKKRLR